MTTMLHTTDDLIAFWKAAAGDLGEADLEAAIPAAIDAMYANRDEGGNMHSAGAAAAVAALRAASSRTEAPLMQVDLNRYIVTDNHDGYRVIDTAPRIRMVVATCGTREYAAMVVSALNRVAEFKA